MDSHGYVYIAQDSGGIVKLPWRDLAAANQQLPQLHCSRHTPRDDRKQKLDSY